MGKLKNWFSPKYWYWRFMMRGKLKLSIDLKKSQPKSLLATLEQKRLLAAFLTENLPVKREEKK